MDLFSIQELLMSTDGILLRSNAPSYISDIVIDSREANKRNAFVALVGENLNGHDFADAAYENGCRTFIKQKGNILKGVEGPDFKNDVHIIEVDNTEIALGDIAKFYKSKFEIPFIGITGSVGKTTTRDMVYSVVSSQFNTLKNEKNFNNQIGVPLTLFNLNHEHECAVVEMGMSGFNEIEYLADIVKPNIGVISNIGQSHIERLGSRLGIFKAKMEITKNFDENSTLIVNGDDNCLKVLNNNLTKYNIKTFGFDDKCSIYCKSFNTQEEQTDFTCVIDNEEYEFSIPTVGEHNIYNAMAAILVGRILGISFEKIREGLNSLKITGMRLEIEKADKFTIINDAYNASPDSMKAALNVLGRYKGRRVAVLGDMFEMGDYAVSGHQSVGSYTTDNTDILITIGELSKNISEASIENGFNKENVFHFNTKDECNLLSILKDNDTILFKASRGMAFETIINSIK